MSSFLQLCMQCFIGISFRHTKQRVLEIENGNRSRRCQKMKSGARLSVLLGSARYGPEAQTHLRVPDSMARWIQSFLVRDPQNFTSSPKTFYLKENKTVCFISYFLQRFVCCKAMHFAKCTSQSLYKNAYDYEGIKKSF